MTSCSTFYPFLCYIFVLLEYVHGTSIDLDINEQNPPATDSAGHHAKSAQQTWAAKAQAQTRKRFEMLMAVPKYDGMFVNSESFEFGVDSKAQNCCWMFFGVALF